MRDNLRGLWLCWALPLIITFLVAIATHKVFQADFAILNIVIAITYLAATIDGVLRLEA
jgi:hypothetical protein